MTKAEYFELLERKLQEFDEELRVEILEDYREHFAEGEICGKSEAVLIAELGDIEDMIAELRAAIGSVKSGVTEKEGVAADVNTAEVAVTALAVEAAGDQSEKNTMPNIRVLRERWDESDPEWLREMEIVYGGECNLLELDGKVADIIMEASPDKKIYITYRNDSDSAKYGFGYGTGEHGNGKKEVFWAGLLVLENQKGTFGRGTRGGRGLLNSLLQGNVWGKDNKLSLHVRVPKGLKSIVTKNSSGQVNVENLQVQELNAGGASGDIVLSSIRVEKLHAATASGDIKMRNAEIIAGGQCSTGSGDIECENVQGRMFNFGTGSGDIECQNVQVLKCNFATGSGDIECQNVQVDNGTFATGSGDIECREMQSRKMVLGTGSGDINCQNLQGDKFTIGSGSGDVRAVVEAAKSVEFGTGSGDGELYLKNVDGITGEFEVGSGEIEFVYGSTQINYSGCRGKKNQLNLGNGGCMLNVSTNSGDIKVKVV